MCHTCLLERLTCMCLAHGGREGELGVNQFQRFLPWLTACLRSVGAGHAHTDESSSGRGAS